MFENRRSNFLFIQIDFVEILQKSHIKSKNANKVKSDQTGVKLAFSVRITILCILNF